MLFHVNMVVLKSLRRGMELRFSVRGFCRALFILQKTRKETRMDATIIVLLILAIVAAVAYTIFKSIEKVTQKENKRKEEAKQQLKEKFDSKVNEYKTKSVVQKAAHRIAYGFVCDLIETTKKNPNLKNIQMSRRIFSYDCVGLWMDKRMYKSNESDWSFTSKADTKPNSDVLWGCWGIDFVEMGLQKPANRHEMYAITTAAVLLAKQYFSTHYQECQTLPKDYRLELTDKTRDHGNRSGDAIFFFEYSAENPFFIPPSTW